jgi:hypothetical protein
MTKIINPKNNKYANIEKHILFGGKKKQTTKIPLKF